MLSFARQLSKRFSLREYICGSGGRGKSVYDGASVGGGKKNWKGAKESIVAPPPPFVHRTKALNSTMHPSKRTIASSLSR